MKVLKSEEILWKSKLSALEKFSKGFTKENCPRIKCGQDNVKRFWRESLKLDPVLNLHNGLKFSLFFMQITDNYICGFLKKKNSPLIHAQRKGLVLYHKIAEWMAFKYFRIIWIIWFRKATLDDLLTCQIAGLLLNFLLENKEKEYN